jgi:putative membrane protein
MTTPEPSGLATPLDDASPERRLHPMSWLFVLIQQLRQFIVPIIVLFAFGRGDRNDLWGLVAICVLAVISIWQYYTYRFRIGGDSLQIRSGLLERSLRQIPFARIQNVALRQTVLHRIFGVAEVRLESAGGIKPEAEMRVLTLADALALEALVRSRRARPRRASCCCA